MGLNATENAYYGYLPVFEAQQNMSIDAESMHSPKYFILGIRLLWALEDTFAQL